MKEEKSGKKEINTSQGGIRNRRIPKSKQIITKKMKKGSLLLLSM